MRMLIVFLLAVLAVIEVGPIPITPLVLLWIVIVRPRWFYQLVLKIYD